MENDFQVITISREDIARIILVGHYKMENDLAYNRANFICNEMMQAIAYEMSEVYFENNLYTDFHSWLLHAWNNLNLDEITCLDAPGGFQVGA